MKKSFLIICLLSILSLISCTDSKSEFLDFQGSSFTNKYSTETSGYVTWYDGADASSVAYYVPELESGWFHCAVSENKLNDIPPGSAIELSANGKTVNLLVTDLCPNSENYHHTSKPNYYFDLEKTAFTTLADKSVGELQMKFKTIPYPTSKNIKFQAKDGINEWWLAGKFYNMRYPLKKVEYSKDGTNFSEMEKLAKNENNWFVIKSGSGLTQKLTFRLTDVFNNVITTNEIKNITENGKYDLGKNFN